MFIEYPKCSTCKKAKKFLEDNHISFIDRNILEETPTYEELMSWYKKSHLPIKKFINTSGLLYKELNLKDKIPSMSDEEILKLISTNGMLIKRPLFIKDNCILTGFNELEWKNKLKKENA